MKNDMLDFASHNVNDWNEAVISFDSSSFATDKSSSFSVSGKEPLRLVTDKIVAPCASGNIKRTRLLEHLENTLKQTSATLVCGRAGTGKTTLAVDFAEINGRSLAWYTVEAADNDWTVFLNYLIAAFDKHRLACQKKDLKEFVGELDESNVALITESIAAWLAVAASEKPLLIVLDDVHLVFDTDWFEEFFRSLVMSLTPDIELLLLSRSQPSLPLWRLRSKQMLSVIEEDLLNFTEAEAIELFALSGLSAELAKASHAQSFGRAAKLCQLAESYKNAAEKEDEVLNL
ncbi:MAG: AAA family ATPase [Acidobacteriota bacterium]|nr:AAA family ATPase [Acidobacteriota bacterium]